MNFTRDLLELANDVEDFQELKEWKVKRNILFFEKRASAEILFIKPTLALENMDSYFVCVSLA